MTSLFHKTANIQSLLPLLADATIKGAILVMLAAIAALALRKKSAASRHAVWSAAVIGHLAIPVFMLLLPAWRIPLLPAAPWVASESTPSVVLTSDAVSPSVVDKSVGGAIDNTPAEQTTTRTEPAVRSAIPSQPATVVSSARSLPVSRLAVVAAIWFVGATLVLLRLALGTWQVGRLARVGARVEDGAWLSLTQRLANRLGVSRPLTLLRGDRLAVPVTWGIVYPAVLLPQEADNWSDDQRRFVLVHEMAHVKRFDALTQLLAQLAVAVFWFDPLVWVAAHQMRVEREHACDDYVLRDGTTPSLYAGELLEMVRSIGTPSHDTAAPAFAALAMARRSEFEGRMLALLDPRLDRQTLPRKGTLMTALIVALLTFPLAALRPFQQPNVTRDELPESFKVSVSAPSTLTPANSAITANQSEPAQPTTKPASLVQSSTSSSTKWTCENYPVGTELHGTSTHIDAHDDGSSQAVRYLVSETGRCSEATIIGKVVFSADERSIVQIPPGAFANFLERTSTADRIVSASPVADGSISYSAALNGKVVPFDAQMQGWLATVMPEILREAAI